jgi:hypothetical protein
VLDGRGAACEECRGGAALNGKRNIPNSDILFIVAGFPLMHPRLL